MNRLVAEHPKPIKFSLVIEEYCAPGLFVNVHMEVRPWSFHVFFRIASADGSEMSVTFLIRQKRQSYFFHHPLNID
jgi:hypothetical protein